MNRILEVFLLLAACAAMAYEGLANNWRSVLLFVAGFLAGWLA